MQRGHDAALPGDVGRGRATCPGRRKATHVASAAVAAFDRDEIGEAGMTFGYGLDGRHAEVGVAELLAELGLEVLPDLFAHSRCATSPSAATLRRSPSALTTLILV